MKTSQFGTFSVLVFFPVILLMIYLMFQAGFSETMPAIILASASFILLLCVLVFYQLTIVIDDEYVCFKFGLGWFGKKYKISEIRSCRPVRNSIWYGIGVRILPNGTLYNVSGLSAIELSFKNKKGIVRIGTDKPKEISEFINSKLGNSEPGSFVPENASGLRMMIFWLAIVLVVCIPTILIYSGKQQTKISVTGSKVLIEGMYGVQFEAREIAILDTVSNMPEIEMRTNGFGLGNTCKGNFRLKDIGQVKLFVVCGYPPYIRIKKVDNQIIYINYKDRQKTIEVYRQINELWD